MGIRDLFRPKWKHSNVTVRFARYRLGVLLAQPSVIQNLPKAAAWIEKAALQEHPGAQRDLGLMYSRGDGVAQDFDKAREWLAKAAGKGDMQARNALSDLPLVNMIINEQRPTSIDLMKQLGKQRSSCPICHGKGWRRNGRCCASCNPGGDP